MSAKRRALTPKGKGWYKGLHLPELKYPEANITSLVYYDQAPSKGAVIEAFETHLWPLSRFSSVVKDDYFVPVEGVMDKNYHFSELEVEDEAAIDAHAAGVMSKPLDHTRPLWIATIIRAKKGRSAVMIRANHVISDGLGLLFAFLPAMSCDSGNVVDNIPLPAILLGKKSTKKLGNGSSEAPSKRRNKFFSFFGGLCSGIWNFWRGIFSILIVNVDAAIKINAPNKDRLPVLPFSGRHTFTRMPSVPMDSIKAVREKHKCTVNDVIMAGLAGAIRRYCAEDLKDPLFKSGQSLECKCTMLLALPRPVSAEDPGVSLCNNIVTPMCKLPIDAPDATSRLQRMVSTCDALKSVAYIKGIDLTVKLLTSIAPLRVLQKAASEAISKITSNVTSLPMSTVPVRMFGQEIKEIQVLFVNNIPQISLMSYNGFVHWNIICDPALIPEPMAIGRHFLEEVKEMA
mmetsp:Transcript_66617/g.104092  ORF Transcript_66617/g.104092 Transcript_66617/m.104092 type:complete len:458 (+) Transcript_66617:40-1413(+)